MKYFELQHIVMDQWTEEQRKDTHILFRNFSTKESRILDRFHTWMDKTTDGWSVKYRDRMYHPSDWRKDLDTEKLGGSKWIPSDVAMERCFSQFIQYTKRTVGKAA